jgi:hypothetical protein
MSDTTAYLAAILILAAVCVLLLVQCVRARRDLAQAAAELDKTEQSFATAADYAVRYQQLYHLAHAELRELREVHNAEVRRCQETHVPAITEDTRPLIADYDTEVIPAAKVIEQAWAGGEAMYLSVVRPAPPNCASYPWSVTR